MKKSKETLYYINLVLRSHNIEIMDEGFMCDDGDIFTNIWEALYHTICLDLISRHIKYKNIDRNCNDYYEILNKRPSYQSIKEKKVGR